MAAPVSIGDHVWVQFRCNKVPVMRRCAPIGGGASRGTVLCSNPFPLAVEIDQYENDRIMSDLHYAPQAWVGREDVLRASLHGEANAWRSLAQAHPVFYCIHLDDPIEISHDDCRFVRLPWCHIHGDRASDPFREANSYACNIHEEGMWWECTFMLTLTED